MSKELLKQFRFHETNTTQFSFETGIGDFEHKFVFDYLVSEGLIERDKVRAERKVSNVTLRSSYALSILEQTMPVEEIVVCDDGSTDETIDIIERLRKNTDIEIRVCVNEYNLGVSTNFQKAVDLCRGDLVFLSDQDDEWYPHKVMTIVDWFEEHPDKSVVFTNADLIDEDGNEFDDENGRHRLFDWFFSQIDRQMFERGLEIECMSHPHATGATMVATKRFLDENPFSARADSATVFHDLVIATRAVEIGQMSFMDETLMGYRVHESQQVGVGIGSISNSKKDRPKADYPDASIEHLFQEPKSRRRISFLRWRV